MAHIAPGITGVSFPGNFMAIKGENCVFHNIRGVKVLEDNSGRDILKLLDNLSRGAGFSSGSGSSFGSSSVSDKNFDDLCKRVETIESYLSKAKKEQGTEGPQGPQGDVGIQGPRGANGKDGARTLIELKDVCLDGLEDGATLVWSAKDKKWVVAFD